MKRRNYKKQIIVIVIILLTTAILGILYYEEQEESAEKKEFDSGIIEDDIDDINSSEENDVPYIEPHIDPETGVKYITYEDIEEKGDIINGIEDNFSRIKKTHEIANKYNYEVRATANKTYHIFNFKDVSPIQITTNTNWNNATFVIHDENINNYETAKSAVIKIINKEAIKDINIPKNIQKEIVINKNTKKIPQLAGYGNCLCLIYDQETKRYIRDGIEGGGYYQFEVARIDNEGNLLNDIIWDYEKITALVLKKMSPENITVQNANFKTILNQDGNQLESGYLARNIECDGSNVTISNIKHTVDDKDKTGGPYYGFFEMNFAANVSLKDCELVTYQCKEKRKSNYDLTINSSSNITIENVTSNDINDANRWGITGTGYTKDITYKNCTLNRIDSHTGVHNLNVLKCTLGSFGIAVAGSGDLNIEDTESNNTECFIQLREDFGSTWDGNINIKNCTIKNIKTPKIIGFHIFYNNGQIRNYGYDLHLPNMNIDGLTIHDENVSNAFGDFCIFYNSKYLTDRDDGELRHNYILPKNVIIKNYTTTSGRKLKLFYNKFYNTLDELGINLSIPLKDKKEALILDEEGIAISNNQITSKKVIIKKQEVEGMKTIVKVNNQEKTEDQIIISEDGEYKIDVIYENTAGDKETKTINVIIDKTPPTILGVKEGYTYKNFVIPRVEEKNLKNIVLILNGQVVQNYKEGTELYEEGTYELTAIDQVGNTSKINFQILESTEEDYKIINQTIRNIDAQTTKTEFTKKIASSEQFKITREKTILDNNNIIQTGDILETTSGKKYTLIVKGDINKDGLTDIKDIVRLRKYLLQISTLSDVEKMAADTNLDNQAISIKDLVRMRIIILTKENE